MIWFRRRVPNDDDDEECEKGKRRSASSVRPFYRFWSEDVGARMRGEGDGKVTKGRGGGTHDF